jgi:ParB family chromosome partitioning protein
MHRIVFGARRFRAAQLAGRATIAAFIHSEEVSDPYDQMIENIQRDDLSAADIAGFIAFRLAAGEKQKDIALRLGNDKSYIAMYASVAQMAPVLRERLATSPIRAVYELHQMWKRSPQAVEAFCAEHDSFTRVQVIAFSQGLSVRPPRMDSSSLSEASNGAAVSHGDNESGELVRLDPSRNAHDGASRSRRPARSYVSSEGLATMLRVEHGRRSGQLILDRGSSKGETHGLVCFDDDCTVEDLPLTALKLVGLKTGLSST